MFKCWQAALGGFDVQARSTVGIRTIPSGNEMAQSRSTEMTDLVEETAVHWGRDGWLGRKCCTSLRVSNRNRFVAFGHLWGLSIAVSANCRKAGRGQWIRGCARSAGQRRLIWVPAYRADVRSPKRRLSSSVPSENWRGARVSQLRLGGYFRPFELENGQCAIANA